MVKYGELQRTLKRESLRVRLIRNKCYKGTFKKTLKREFESETDKKQVLQRNFSKNF